MWTWLESTVSLPMAVWGGLLLVLILIASGITAYVEQDREKRLKRQQYGARLREIERLKQRLDTEQE